MQSNMHDFPADELLECLRNNRQNSGKFIQEANNLNTEWIYEIIKHCHNTMTEPKELPPTKLNALIMIKELMETCQIPCINLIEVYVLPVVYEIAIFKPQDKGQKRGSTFFQVNGRAAKLPNIQEIGIKFVGLCSQILSAGSIIKPKRSFQSQQLRHSSDFFDYFENFQKYVISPAHTSLSSLKNFSPEFAAKGRENYLRNLKQFHRGKNNYSEYFVTKIIDSVETDNNPLLNNGQSVSSLSNDLDMRKLLKQADTLITTPLIDQLLLKLKTIPSFMSKKHCLSLLTDFVKWGDIEALIKVCSESGLEKTASRIAEVEGNKGSQEGEKIYPEVKGQREGKKKFYTQFLKSIEVIANCLENLSFQIQSAQNIKELYRFFKKQKKFQFPQNLMAKKIQTEFQQNLENNRERNQLVLKRLKQGGSVIHKRESRLSKQQGAVSETYIEINKNLEDCLEEILKVTLDQKEVNARMTRVVQLKNRYEDQIEKIDENNSEIGEDQIEEILDNGQEITKIVEKLQILQKDYNNKTINFEQFKQRHASLTKQYQDQSLEHSRGSQKNLGSSNGLGAKHSLEQVVSSFNVKKIKNSQDITPNFQNGAGQNYDETVKAIQPKLSNSFENKKKPNRVQIQNKPTQPFYSTVPENNDQVKITNGYRSQPNGFTGPIDAMPKSFIQQSEEQILNQVTSSILSNKEDKKKPLKQESKISEIRNEDGSSKVFSESKSLQQRVMARKKERQSKIKQLQHVESQLSQKNQQSKFHSVNNENESSFKNSSEQKNSKLSNNGKVEYIEYVSPQSIRIEKLHEVSRNPMQINTNLLEPKFTSTVPQLKNGLDPGIGRLDNYLTYPNENQPKPYPTNEANQISQNMSSQYNFASIAKANNFIPVDKVDQSANSLSKLSENKSDIKSIQRSVKAHSILSQQANERSSESNKENPKKSKFADALGAPIPSNIHDHFSQSQHNSQFKTCKASLSRNENIDEQEQNFVLNSKEYAEQQANYQKVGEKPKNYEYFSAKSSSFSNSASIRMHMPQKQFQLENEESCIKQPPFNPAENSYYGPKDIEAEVRQAASPQFKKCFQIQKQLIPSAHNFTYDLPELLAEQNGSRTKKVGASNLSSKQSLVKPHEQYMIAKLKRYIEKEKDNGAKQLGSRVLSLKVDNSKLRNQLKIKQRMNEKSRQSESDRYSSVQEFSNSKSRPSNSPQIRRHPQKSGVSAISSIVAQGNLINQNLGDRFFSELNDEKIKKACLRNKTIIYKSDLWEIGCMFKSTQQGTTLTLYMTPNSTITNFKYSISKQPNLDIETSSKGYTQIPSGKQVKLQILCKLQNIPYNLPLMSLRYRVGSEEKNISFYLPLTFNKFVKFVPVDPSKINDQLRNAQKVLRTSQFDVNSKIAKTSSILQYFPSMVNIGEEFKQKITRYAAMGTFRNENFFILLTTKGKDKVLLQGKPSNPNYRQYVEYLMLTIKKLMSI